MGREAGATFIVVVGCTATSLGAPVAAKRVLDDSSQSDVEVRGEISCSRETSPRCARGAATP